MWCNPTKLPRGSYYYVSLGDKFFAGVAPVIEQREIKKQAALRSTPKGAGKRYWYNHAPWSQQVAVKPHMVREHTGRSEHHFVDDPSGAKQFRRTQSVQACVEQLKMQYGSLGVAPKIHLHTPGDTA